MLKFKFYKYFEKIILISCFIYSGYTLSQDNQVLFNNKVLEFSQNIDSFKWSNISQTAQWKDGYYMWASFEKTPNQSIQDELEKKGIIRLAYVPNNIYQLYIPKSISVHYLKSIGIHSLDPIAYDFKISKTVHNNQIPTWANDEGKLLLTVQYYKNIELIEIIEDLKQHDVLIKNNIIHSKKLIIAIEKEYLNQIASLPYIKWIELPPAPTYKQDISGRSLTKNNALDTQTSSGRNYTGEGIGVLVRDDGYIGPHIDFQGRLDDSRATGYGERHGDGVSGILSGAGNLDPTKRGMAAGSDLYVINHRYQGNLYDLNTIELLDNGLIQIANTSYGQICSDGYNTVTEDADIQQNEYPNFLNVFGAGNDNPHDCGYGAGEMWGNISGGHTQSKNSIAVANLDFEGDIVYTSSRGPAYDGRIKPDIGAQGLRQETTDENNSYYTMYGTSAAAPGIAGLSAQLYQIYNDINSSLPPSALIKGTILNTATDLGNPGPDFKYGWGAANALRAGRLIENGHFLINEIEQGVTNGHTITVPTGTTQVRFMLYWGDHAATPGVNTALVNDIDLTAKDPTNNTHLPWVLDSTPDPILLDLPATQGADHLNNMEQILINSPIAGDYLLEIKGNNIPFGPQDYVVVYDIIDTNVEITYPNNSEKLIAGEDLVIHWDAFNISEDFLLEYSIDNGSNWEMISTVDKEKRTYEWEVPEVITGKALIKITSGSFSDISNSNFNITEPITNLEISKVCANEIILNWDAVQGAEYYEVYSLGEKYMEIISSSAINSIDIPISDPFTEKWFAVKAINDTNGWETRRSNAILHPGGYVNCSFTNDIAIVTINNEPYEFNKLCNDENLFPSIKIKNFGSEPQTGFSLSYQLNEDDIISEDFPFTIAPMEEVTFEFSEPLIINLLEDNSFKVFCSLSGDQNTGNDQMIFNFHYQENELPNLTTQTFETPTFPPEDWTIYNPDSLKTWKVSPEIIGADGLTTKAAFVDNYSYDTNQERDGLETGYYQLNLIDPYLTFDFAKAQNFIDIYDDEFRVDISADCGESFSTIFYGEGEDLATIPGFYFRSANWFPSSEDDWRRIQIALNDYENQKIFIRFVNINGFGNSTFVDNVRINGEPLNINDEEFDRFIIYPNPTSDYLNIRSSIPENTPVDIKILDVLGRVHKNYNTHVKPNLKIRVTDLKAGIYFIELKTSKEKSIKKFIVE